MAARCLGSPMTRYLIDADIALYAMQRRPQVVAAFAHAETDDLFTSTIVYSQLLQGLPGHAEPVAERARIEVFLHAVALVPYTEPAARAYGIIIDKIGFSRAHTLDRMIAAHAISLDATLVTNNTGDFADIDGLRLENWAA